MSFSRGPGGARNLEDLDKMYMEYYDPRACRVRSRLLADDHANLDDAIDMIDILLENHQGDFILNKSDPFIINLPNLFIEPEVGDEIRNLTTSETYLIDALFLNEIGNWTGWVKISGPTAPDAYDRIEFVDKKHRYINFMFAYPALEAKEQESTVGAEGHANRTAFVPTITARVTKQEPATMDRTPMGPRKILKGRILDQFRDKDDPYRYSITLKVTALESIVRFDCWSPSYRQAHKLATWFRHFMATYIGVLKKNGVQEIIFWDMNDNDKTDRWRDGIAFTHIRFWIRTHETEVIRQRNLTNLVLSFRVATNPDMFMYPYTGEVDCGWRPESLSGEYQFGTFIIEDHHNTGELPDW